MKVVKSKHRARAQYRRMPGMKYHTRVDFPRKCEGCGGATANMHRHGYQAREGNEYYWKKFMCISCNKIMKRPTGYVPVSGIEGTPGYTMDEITPKRLNQDTKSIATRATVRSN
jgi:hypothetical protein